MSSSLVQKLEDLGKAKERYPKFLYRVLPGNIGDLKMVIPDNFHNKYGAQIPRKVNLYFPNGDLFKCEYVRAEKCFVGTVKIFRRYSVASYSVLCFQYFSLSDFYVTIIGPASVEVEYPFGAKVFPFEVERVCYDYRGVNTNNITDDNVAHGINAVLVQYNGGGGGEPSLQFLFSGGEVSLVDRSAGCDDPTLFPEGYWSDKSGIHICVRGLCSQVYVRKMDGHIKLGEGWSKFVETVGLSVGDYVVMTQYGNPFHFETAIFKDYDRIGQRFSSNTYQPLEFARFVNKELISSGEMYVPRIFWDKYVKDLDGEVRLEVRGRSTNTGYYMRDTHKLVGLQAFVAAHQIWKSKVLHFRYVGNSAFSVSIISKDWVAVM